MIYGKCVSLNMLHFLHLIGGKGGLVMGYKCLIVEFRYYLTSLTVKAATLIFISGRGSAIPSAKEGKPGFIYNLVKSS